MPQYFPHENLEVYAHALSFAKSAAALIDSWPAVFAVCDQWDPATGSIVTNLAKAASLMQHRTGSIAWSARLVRQRYTRRTDELSTSLTIHIAEGNGRFSKVDHSKFVSIAEDAGTKLAADLDLAAAALMKSAAAKSC